MSILYNEKRISASCDKYKMILNLTFVHDLSSNIVSLNANNVSWYHNKHSNYCKSIIVSLTHDEIRYPNGCYKLVPPFRGNFHSSYYAKKGS